MPYTKIERRELCDTKFKTMKELEPGDAVYIFYKHFVKLWLETTKFKTAFFIHCLVERPEKDVYIWDLSRDMMFKGLTKSEIQVAREMAVKEFDRRYLSVYEDCKILENGDVL